MGKRKSLLIGLAIVFRSLVAYALSCSFWSFLVVEIVLALGFTFVSSPDETLRDALGSDRKLIGDAFGFIRRHRSRHPAPARYRHPLNRQVMPTD